MLNLYATQNTILGNLQPKSKLAQSISTLFIVLLGTLLLTASAKINIPLIPVAATFQTMAVAIIAAAFGWRIGVATVALYLMQGAMGLPVFALGSGFAYLMGPTGGFLLGFLPAAFIIGKMADMGASKNFFTLFVVMIAADIVIFAFGFTWLMAFAGSVVWLDQANLMSSAYAIAIEPFILWDTLKMALAAMSIYGGWKLLKSIKS